MSNNTETAPQPDVQNDARLDQRVKRALRSVPSRRLSDIDSRERLVEISNSESALAMAAKAGQAVSGFAKVEEALAGGQAKALIHASDGAADGIRKLDAIIRQRSGNHGESLVFPIVTELTSAELDLALGRANVIHAALLAGPAGKTFLSRSQILVRYRMADDDKTAGAAKNSD